MRHYILYTFLFGISFSAYSQASLTFNTALTNGGSYTTCQSITLAPGFSFTSGTNKTLILKVDPFNCDPNAGQSGNLSAGQNYIRTRTYLKEDASRYTDQIQYFDGLGRLTQTVQRGITPDAQDLVSLQEYDNFGRESNTWLPAKIAGNNGAYVAPNTIISQAKASHAGDANPYSRPVYEASPLNRIIKQFGPGQDWQNPSAERAVQTAYKTNISADKTLNCILYTATGSNNAPTLAKNNNYATGELYVTEIKDENGNTGYEFKDKLGQVILTRQINEGIGYDTYYVYNDFGNLCFVLPPRLDAEGISQDKLNQLAYLYKYDERNRCIYKKLPGCDPIYYVYDKADRLIFSQDGEQRIKGEWTFNKYDVFGRPIISGFYKTTQTQDALIAKCKNIVVTEKPGGAYEYTWNSLPEIPYTGTLSLNYYDNYYTYFNATLREKLKFVKKDGFSDRYINSTLGEGTPKGLLIGTRIKTIGADGAILGEIASKIYYDNKGRIIQTMSTNHLGGIDEEHIAYNFTGQPVKKIQIHTTDTNGNGKKTELYTYNYDHAGRLVEIKHQLNNGAQVSLAYNTYDDQGRLKTNVKAGATNLTTTYTYNIRSWTESINSPLFKENLYYNKSYAGNKPQYNGNISAMNWTLSGDVNNKSRGYTFTYNNLSMLRRADYLENGTANTNYSTQYTYDKHGNMTYLRRQGKTSGGDTFGLIDEFTSMTYSGNQLLQVKDGAGNINIAASSDFKDYTAGKGQYTYNKNGALASDTHKGVSKIEYNFLNLPRAITIANSQHQGNIGYTYSASGQKLRVVHAINQSLLKAPLMGATAFATATSKTETTDYVGNIIYENNILKRILVDGGYYDAVDKKYYFYLTDHLGNNRVVADQSGTAIQKNHYYPFGMTFGESTDPDTQPYKYNGKELDRKLGLNLYDYSARQMDNAVPRFTSIDPMAEKYYSISPYVYCNNNPIKYIDPDGKQVGIPFRGSESIKNSALNHEIQKLQIQAAKPAAIGISLAATILLPVGMVFSHGYEANLILKGPETGTLGVYQTFEAGGGTPNLSGSIFGGINMSSFDGDERRFETKALAGHSEETSLSLNNLNINSSKGEFADGNITGVGIGIDLKSKGLFSKGLSSTGKVSSELFSVKIWNNNDEKFNKQDSAKDYYIRRYTNINEYKNVTGAK